MLSVVFLLYLPSMQFECLHNRFLFSATFWSFFSFVCITTCHSWGFQFLFKPSELLSFSTAGSGLKGFGRNGLSTDVLKKSRNYSSYSGVSRVFLITSVDVEQLSKYFNEVQLFEEAAFNHNKDWNDNKSWFCLHQEAQEHQQTMILLSAFMVTGEIFSHESIKPGKKQQTGVWVHTVIK